MRAALTALALLCALTAAPAGPRRESACDVRELRFFNGFALSLPAGLCVGRTSGPDYWIYELAAANGAPPFLRFYAGNAANLPYVAPPEGTRITELTSGEPLACGALVIRETRRGEVTEVGGAVTIDGTRCGEVLVRRTASPEGGISSPALHFWYSGLTEEQEKAVRTIIASVRPAEPLPDDPPLKSRRD